MWGNNTVGRPAFVLGLAWRIALFAVVAIGLPLLIFQIGSTSNCGTGCQGTGILILVLMFAMGPIGILLLLITLPGLLMRRFRAIGISPWWTLFVLLLIVANYKLLAYPVMLLAPAFSRGSGPYLERPDYLFEAIAVLAVMAILPSRDGRVALSALGWPAITALIIAAIVAFGAAVSAVDSLPGLTLTLLPLRLALKTLAWPMLAALIAFPLATLVALWPRDGQLIENTPAPRLPADPLPLIPLGLVAAALTLAALIFGMPEMGLMTLIALPAIVAPIGLPTFAAYGAIILAIYMLAVRRGPAAYAALAVALLVAGSFAWPFVTRAQSTGADHAAIAAVPVAPPPADRPSLVVVDGTGRVELLRRGDIRMVLERSRSGKIEAYVRGDGGRPQQSSTPPTVMPTRYLHLLTGEDSSFAADRTRYVWGSPFELRLVDGTSDQLLGAWYERDPDMPRFPPLLTLSGWMPQPHISNGPEAQLLKAFLDRTLGPAPAPKS